MESTDDRLIMTGIKVEELTASGFVEILSCLRQQPIYDFVDQNEAVAEVLKNLFVNKDYHIMTKDGVGVCIRGLENKTFRVTKITEKVLNL